MAPPHPALPLNAVDQNHHSFSALWTTLNHAVAQWTLYLTQKRNQHHLTYLLYRGIRNSTLVSRFPHLAHQHQPLDLHYLPLLVHLRCYRKADTRLHHRTFSTRLSSDAHLTRSRFSNTRKRVHHLIHLQQTQRGGRACLRFRKAVVQVGGIEGRVSVLVDMVQIMGAVLGQIGNGAGWIESVMVLGASSNVFVVVWLGEAEIPFHRFCNHSNYLSYKEAKQRKHNQCIRKMKWCAYGLPDSKSRYSSTEKELQSTDGDQGCPTIHRQGKQRVKAQRSKSKMSAIRDIVGTWVRPGVPGRTATSILGIVVQVYANVLCRHASERIAE